MRYVDLRSVASSAIELFDKLGVASNVERLTVPRFLEGLVEGSPLPPVYEIPTIPALIASLFKESIDNGIRTGIPKESLKDVITVYGSDGSVLTR